MIGYLIAGMIIGFMVGVIVAAYLLINHVDMED
jgi:hypothetical protein